MKALLYILLLLFVSGICTQAQDTTRINSSADSLLAELADTSSESLLPEKIMVTQSIFWGKRGLFRQVGWAPLTADGRQQEMKIRRTMLGMHQVSGLLTLAGMIGQGIIGAQLYHAKGERYVRLRATHTGLATFINISYGTTALLTLTAPPSLVNRRKGRWNSIRVHKTLAYVHFAGMVATNLLAKQIVKNPELKPYHRVSAYTTFAAFGAAIIAIKF